MLGQHRDNIEITHGYQMDITSGSLRDHFGITSGSPDLANETKRKGNRRETERKQKGNRKETERGYQGDAICEESSA